MSMVPFSEFFPDLAFDECRFVLVGKERPDGGLDGPPEGGFGLMESYCADPECDCRRVLITAIEVNSKEVLATINYGFDRDGAMPGPFLDPMCKQSKHAHDVLEGFRYVLRDREYAERLEHHYRMVKDEVEARQIGGAPRVRMLDRRLSSVEAKTRIAEIKADRKRQRRAAKRARLNRNRRAK